MVVGVGVVVLVVAVFAVRGVLPNRAAPVPGDATAGRLPNMLAVEGVNVELPKRPLPVPPLRDGVDEAGVAALVAPNAGFCSPGLAPVLPNKLPEVGVPEKAGAALPLPLAAFPKEKVGVLLAWPPKRPPGAVVDVVDDPKSPPLAGAEVVVLLLVVLLLLLVLLGCPEELGAPKRDIVLSCPFCRATGGSSAEANGLFACYDGM